MFTEVDARSPKTKEFIKYIFQKLTEKYPLEYGEIVYVDIKENVTPFPKVSENILKNDRGKLDKKLNLIEKRSDIFQYEGTERKKVYEIVDWPQQDYNRHTAVVKYVENYFKELCPIKIPVVQSVKPIEINFPFLIKNPKKIYEGAKKLGVKINRKNKIHNADYKVKITEKTYHLFLNDKGELWRNPKEKYCYKMLAGSGRHKIVEFFITSKLYDYYPAQEIANNLKDGNTKALIKEIGVINSLVKKKIQIRCKILDSQPPAEYRINPRVSIAATKK